MTIQYGATLRTNMMGQIQTTVSTSGTLLLFSGAKPANCAASDPAGTLGTITLPATFLTSAAGVTALAGTWAGTASGAGSAASFRIKDGSAVVHAQGTVTATGGGGDLTLDNVVLAVGQAFSVSACAITEGNP